MGSPLSQLLQKNGSRKTPYRSARPVKKPPCSSKDELGVASKAQPQNLIDALKRKSKMEYLVVMGVAAMMGAYTMIIRNCLKDS